MTSTAPLLCNVQHALDCVCVCECGSTVSCAAVFKTILFGVHVDPQHISHHMTRASSTCGHEDMQS